MLTGSAESVLTSARLAALVGGASYAPISQTETPLPGSGEVLVTELDNKFLRGLYSDMHRLMSDEPEKYGGSNLGPTPYELLLMSLGACTSMTMRMYANRKKLPLEDIKVKLDHERVHAEDCVDCDKKSELITRSISLQGNLSDEQLNSLLSIADKCPVHRTLESDLKIATELVKDPLQNAELPKIDNR